MKRTQEEIKRIAEEIRLNVESSILQEEKSKMISRLDECRLSAMAVSMVLGSYRQQEQLIHARLDCIKTLNSLSEYRKKVMERL